MRYNISQCLFLILIFIKDFFLSKNILILLIIILFASLFDKLLSNHEMHSHIFYIILGVIPSIVFSVPISFSCKKEIFMHRRVLCESFEKIGFRVYENSEKRLMLVKKKNTLFEWNSRRIIVEKKEQHYEVEILLCDKRKFTKIVS